MASLFVDSVLVPVEAGNVTRRREDTVTHRRRFSGVIDVEQRASTFGRVRVWRVATPFMERADVLVIQETLLADGTRSVSGELVGSPAAECYVSNISKLDGPTEDYAALAFELHEVP
jgi:hypothetical protein